MDHYSKIRNEWTTDKHNNVNNCKHIMLIERDKTPAPQKKTRLQEEELFSPFPFISETQEEELETLQPSCGQ